MGRARESMRQSLLPARCGPATLFCWKIGATSRNDSRASGEFEQKRGGESLPPVLFFNSSEGQDEKSPPGGRLGVCSRRARCKTGTADNRREKDAQTRSHPHDYVC